MRVIRTDEEWMIASTVCRVLKLGAVKKERIVISACAKCTMPRQHSCKLQ